MTDDEPVHLRMEDVGLYNEGTVEVEAVPGDFGWDVNVYVQDRYGEVKELQIADSLTREYAVQAATRWIARLDKDTPAGQIR
jgi:hypothetical protein